ncbi:hypothetical protein IAU60_006323 [Kwoniella sp. DSM 27419]
MQAHRGGPTPPPLPRNPTRSMSASTTSTSYTQHSSAQAHGLMPPASPLGGLASPVSLYSGRGYGGGMGRQESYNSAASNDGDELDKLGYSFSLRVAILHHHLMNPPPPPMPHRPSTSSFSPHGAGTSPIPPLPSPPLTGTSPNGSRFTFSSFSPPPIPVTPEMGSSANGGTPSPGPGRRKSSGFGLSLGRNKSDDGGVKLPKEFLIEFWGLLGAEDGDAGWKATTAGFLGMVKKGTKTPSGLNLREVPTLLEAFTACIPAPTPGTSPAHAHQSHLLQLLYNSLPRSSFFSPLAKPQSEKDRDFLFRLRAEVQSYMLSASPNPDSDPAHSAMANGSHSSSPPPQVRRKSSGMGLGRISTHSNDNIRRKPSPVWDGDVNEMVETVGLVWGVRKDMLDRDVADVKKSGALDQLYMADLKRAMSALSSHPPPLTPSQKNRQASLSQAIAGLLKDFPELAAPGSVPDFSAPHSPDASRGGDTAFFSPPRPVEVFGRLATKAGEAGHSTRTRDLVERCRDVWGIASRREKEKEMEGLAKRWADSIGSKEEVAHGRAVADGVKLMSYGQRPTDPLPPVMTDLLNTLMSLVTTSVQDIFPTTSAAVRPPPPSLLIIFNASPSSFTSQPQAAKTLENTSDELKGAAIGEYVQAVEHLTGGIGQPDDGLRMIGASGKDARVEGFEKVALWMEKEVSGIKKAWGRGLDGALNPAAIVISRQLPLFLAELQVIDRPRGAASDIFTLYETTGKLLDLWEELCPKQEHGFELDAFFEPHVVAWLRDTETNNIHDWVSRAVGMDSWVPEGENRHSQSVIDLFDFVRTSAQVILHELPLSEYKRAMFLIDYSKTVSCAVSSYATTVLALFQHEMSPAKASTPTSEIQNKLGGKAGSWLAKGQQAVKALERKKVDGFMVPPAACVKLTDMGAAQICLEDLVYAMEAEDTLRIVKAAQARSGATQDKSTRHLFTVTILRGESLVGRAAKPADGFVCVVDRETGERLIKTRTVLGAEDPRWEQSFEVSVGVVKTLELQTYDRQLVGKHDLIGTAAFKLDPRAFNESSTRDIVLPLSSRGLVHVRISMEGGEKHDVHYHLASGSRALDRAASDMTREIVDRMGEFIKVQLSSATLQHLVKPLKDKKNKKTALSESDVEQSLTPLFDYLNENFSIFSVTLTHDTRLRLMLSLWRRIVDTLISLLVPPLSERLYSGGQLGSSEIDVVFKWLQLLKGFFNASEGGVEHGVPLVQLQSGNYKDLIMLGQYLDLPTPALKERTSAAVRAAGKHAGGHLGSSMRSMRVDEGGAGAVTAQQDEGERMAEVLLRICRTRPDMGDFLAQEVGLLQRGKVEKQAGVA